MNGKNLKEKLQADGVNLSALARKMGYATDQNLHSVLGAKDVRSGLIEDLAKVLNKPIGWFYEEEASSTFENNGVDACEANDMDIKKFRETNDIRQIELADYLGVSKGYLCNVEAGRVKLSRENKKKLLNNPNGWDTSMLIGNVTANASNHSSASVSIGSTEADNMRKEIERLNTLLEEEKKRSAQYWEIIQKLMSKWNPGI